MTSCIPDSSNKKASDTTDYEYSEDVSGDDWYDDTAEDSHNDAYDDTHDHDMSNDDLDEDEMLLKPEDSGSTGETHGDHSDGRTINEPPTEDFKVELGAKEQINLGESGELEVWIGAQNRSATFSDDMIRDESTIAADIGNYAKIKPYAPDFEISPAEVACIKIDPSGSHVRFTITPKREGILKVSADIYIYENPTCTGTSVPKVAASLNVNVTVDQKKVIDDKLSEMGDVVWDKFMIFWGSLLALVFGAFLYFIKKKLDKAKES